MFFAYPPIPEQWTEGILKSNRLSIALLGQHQTYAPIAKRVYHVCWQNSLHEAFELLDEIIHLHNGQESAADSWNVEADKWEQPCSLRPFCRNPRRDEPSGCQELEMLDRQKTISVSVDSGRRQKFLEISLS
jgi:hypothetical protein